MAGLLVRLFVKEPEKTDDRKVRAAYGMMSSVVGVVLNVLLFGVKMVIGLLINSISVTADAVNNLSDAGSSIISFIGVKLAKRPADQEHPFGHGRIEYIAAFVIAVVILIVGFSLFQDSLDKVFHPQPISFDWVMITILGLSVFIKLWLALFNRKYGKKINSNIMHAASADSFNDVIVTTATILSIIIGHIFSVNIDGWMGIGVSAFVFYSGFDIAKTALMPLLGEAANRDVFERITNKVESYEGIVGTHDLIAHNYGPAHTMATIHAEVPNNSDIEEIHETIDRIERDVLRDLGIFLVIHMDPVETDDETVLEKKRMVDACIRELEPKASIHDFRIVNGEHDVNFIFDLVVPHSYTEKDEEQLMERLIERINQTDKAYHCVVTIEKNYIAARR